MLRPYQREALLALQQAYSRGVHRAIVSLPTGTGKTKLFPALPATFGLKSDEVMVVLAHREELIDQAAARLKADLPIMRVGKEKADVRAHPKCNVVVASVQSLHEQRLDEFLRRFDRRIAILVVDECHHAVASGYVRTIDAVTKARPDAAVVGVTATTPRDDGVALGHVFEEVVYHRDMRWAIDDGWLVSPRCFTVEGQTDLQRVAIVRGDYALSPLARTINTRRRNDVVVGAYREHLAGRKTVVFCTTIEHAKNLNDAFVTAGVASRWASGETPAPQRRSILRAFRDGTISVLINCMLWVEGFDEPTVEAIINARPTRSRSLYIQICGRGTRPHPSVASELGTYHSSAERRAVIGNSPKSELVVIDIIDDNAHDLVTLPSIIGKAPKELEDPGEPTFADGEASPTASGEVREYEEVRDDPALSEPAADTGTVVTLTEANRFQTGASAERPDRSKMLWFAKEPGLYELVLPPRWRCGDRDDVNAEFSLALSRARRAGEKPEHEYAARELGLNPADVALAYESLKIAAVADSFRVTLIRNGNSRTLGIVAEQHEAFTRAERWVANNRPDAHTALFASASWRDKPATKAQLDLLRREFGVLDDALPGNRGDASSMITHLFDDRRHQLNAGAA